MIETILLWMAGLGFYGVEPEHLGTSEGSVGLFCRGREVIRRWQDIMGNRLCRQKVVFLVAMRSRSPEPLELALALEEQLQQTAPYFGEDQRILLEKGRTVKDNGSGFPVREFQLTVEYTTKEE